MLSFITVKTTTPLSLIVHLNQKLCQESTLLFPCIFLVISLFFLYLFLVLLSFSHLNFWFTEIVFSHFRFPNFSASKNFDFLLKDISLHLCFFKLKITFNTGKRGSLLSRLKLFEEHFEIVFTCINRVVLFTVLSSFLWIS